MKVPIRSFATRLDIIGRPDSELLSVYREHGVVPKSSRDDNFNKPSEDLSTYRYVRPGNLVLNKMKTWQGSLAVSEFEGIVSPAYFVCELSDSVHPRFIHHLIRSDPLIAEYGARSKGIRPNQWDLPYDDFKSIEVELPPIEEQRRIADFLDDQVGRVDQAIALRKGQIQQIRERAETRLITEILKPTSSTVRVKNLIEDERLGAWGEEPDGVDDVHVVRVADFNRDDLIVTEAPTIRKLSSSQAAPRILCRGDVLLERSGGGAEKPVGFAVLFEPSNNELHISSNFVSRLRPKPQVSGPYLRYILAAMYYARWNAAHYTQTTGIQNLQSEPYLGLSVPFHDTQAQLALVKDMDSFFDATSTSVKALEDSIGMLEERKRSLITAAVTGQLDVTAVRPLVGPWVPRDLSASVESPSQGAGVAL